MKINLNVIKDFSFNVFFLLFAVVLIKKNIDINSIIPTSLLIKSDVDKI